MSQKCHDWENKLFLLPYTKCVIATPAVCSWKDTSPKEGSLYKQKHKGDSQKSLKIFTFFHHNATSIDHGN